MLALIACAPSSLALAQTQTTEMQAVSGPGEVDRTTQTEDVRFKTDATERMTVPVKISGAGPFRFLIDTGADRTAVSRELASRMKFASAENASLHSLSGVSTVSTATVPSLQLTRKEIRNINAPLLEGVNIGADGILGTDSLRSQRVLFDFEAQTLSVVPSAVPDFKAEPGTIVIQGTRRNGRLVVTDAAANGHSLTVVIDTGAQLSIGNEALREKLVGRGLFDPLQKVELQSVTGAMISGDYMFVRELEIGGLKIKNLAIVFADAHTFKKLKLDRKPALLLGMNAIRAFKKVSIDFASRKFRVVLPETSQLDVRFASARLK
jgi:predicted aspartyl protease